MVDRRFSPFQRALRRCGWVRYAALTHIRLEREKVRTIVRYHEFNTVQGFGVYVNTWAVIERILNSFIVQYHPNSKQKRLPDTLLEKIKYLAEVSKDERLPPELRRAFKRWATGLGREKDYRDMIVHGVGHSRWGGERFEWTFETLRLVGGSPKLIKKEFDQFEFTERLRAIGIISHDIATTLTPVLYSEYCRH